MDKIISISLHMNWVGSAAIRIIHILNRFEYPIFTVHIESMFTIFWISLIKINKLCYINLQIFINDNQTKIYSYHTIQPNRQREKEEIKEH